MNEREWVALAKQLGEVTRDADGDAYCDIPVVSNRWTPGGITLHRRGDGWGAQFEIDSRPPGEPYSTEELRALVIDLTRAYEISKMLENMPLMEATA